MKLFAIIGALLIFIHKTTEYSPAFPFQQFLRIFPTTPAEISVLEPFYIDKKTTPCVVFFTGGSNTMSWNIYSHFLNEMVKQNVSVYAPDFQYKSLQSLVEILQDEYKEVVFMGHSSGCSSLMQCLQNNNITKIVLLDPVDTRLATRMQNYRLRPQQQVFFVNAMKSYQSTNRTVIPFIPAVFRLEPKHFEGGNCRVVETYEYGHCDLLNPFYANLMYNIRLSEGNPNRTTQQLFSYYEWLSQQIVEFLHE